VGERGIGRGLAAILPSPAEQTESLQQVPVDLIDPNPRQPRTGFDEGELRALADSIEARGVLQPVLVRSLPGGRYELVAGERRLRAAKLAGLGRVPALCRSTEESERLELALIENMARQDLNPVDAARACAALVDELGLTKEEVGRRVGRSRSAISNMIRILELPDEVLAMVESGELSEGHGRAILQLRDRSMQRVLARRARDEALSVRKTEDLARGAEGGKTAKPQRRAPLVPADALEACRELEESLGAIAGGGRGVGLSGVGLSGVNVRVRPVGRGAKVELSFEDFRQAQELARRLAGPLAA
jgi:ParB family transcriptional regulator, chromosome partitioning protein